ncbi:hypothetical protein Aau02nite_11360 [Amorphoplanes auranticolor]|uniref:Uncharacterized protein n=1 Tax=Actinoplanes auranticolor TaxID=47988 RepID=A0A919S4R8_9ACTN|nr:hypothetical protein Aau02nite_11360 [Actinoplanes auranticolor]
MPVRWLTPSPNPTVVAPSGRYVLPLFRDSAGRARIRTRPGLLQDSTVADADRDVSHPAEAAWLTSTPWGYNSIELKTLIDLGVKHLLSYPVTPR